MSALTTISRELAGLFIDDGLLAIGAVVVIVVAAALRALLPAGPILAAVVLCLGIPAVLVANIGVATRQARSRQG